MSGDRGDPAEASLGCLLWLMSVTVDVDRLGRAWAQPRRTHRANAAAPGGQYLAFSTASSPVDAALELGDISAYVLVRGCG